jgi:dTDP-4-amino-4,6-dideoxygalactose transaminase
MTDSMPGAPETDLASSQTGGEIERALRVPIARPSLGREEAEAAQEAIESGWVVQGPRVAEFERLFSEYTGAGHSCATTSCTTALHLAVTIQGLGPGDEVVVPAYTWVSTANVVEYAGATPRFCDIDLSTFNVDAAAAADVVGPNTVGMIPVHLFGLCADMDALAPVLAERGLWSVEDAACALGAWHRGRHAGTIGDMGAFSFHPRKSVTTGEGGMLTTADADWDELARSLREHGADRSDLQRHGQPKAFLLSGFPHLGFNYRMTDVQGAMGCVQMRRADEILDERRRRAAFYDEALADLEWLRTPVVPDGYVHGYQSYVCLFAPEEPDLGNLDRLAELRDGLMATMERQGIATRQGTHAAALTAYYSEKYGISREQFPNAAIAERLTIAIPLFAGMSDSDQELVVSELRSAYEAL